MLRRRKEGGDVAVGGNVGGQAEVGRRGAWVRAMVQKGQVGRGVASVIVDGLFGREERCEGCVGWELVGGSVNSVGWTCEGRRWVDFMAGQV